MFRIEICCFYIVLFFCQISEAEAEDELSPMVVFKLLSLRIDNVVHETKNLKSELAETKAVVDRVERKIEQFHTNISLIVSKTDKNEKESSESFSNEKDKSNPGVSASLSERKLKMQTDILRKMLLREKSHMRKTVEKFENRLKLFESDIENKLTLTSDSFGISFDNLNHSIIDSLMSLENNVQNIDDQTSDLIQTMNINFENKLIETETEVSQLLAIVNSTLQTTKNGLSGRLGSVESKLHSMSIELNSAESKLRPMSSRVNSVESKLRSMSSDQDRQKEKVSSQIKDLSSRIAVKEARRIAFSSIMDKKQNKFGKSEILVFDKVIYSYGGGYSPSTGIFTAPKSGTYLFTFNVQPPNGKMAHVLLIKEGGYLTRAIVSSDDKDVTGGNAGIVYVKAGEKVWVQTALIHENYYIWPYRTTFNGILID